MNKQSSLRSILNSTSSQLTIPAAVFAIASQGFAQSYTVVDLGTLGGENSFARDINNAGQITGTAYTGASPGEILYSSFLWQDGVMIDIGTLDGQSGYSYANAINNLAQICGSSQPDGTQQHAFLWQEGVMIDLGTLGGAASEGHDINDLGDIVGVSFMPSSSVHHPVLWTDGKIIDLGLLTEGLGTHAWGINNYQEIVGDGSISNSIPRGFLWRDRDMTVLPMLDEATKSSAYKINDDGAIVGHMKVAEGNWHPVIWLSKDYPDITIIDLGVPEQFSSGITYNLNNLGQVVGWYLAYCGEEDFCPFPFIWQNGELSMLDDLIPTDSGWDLRYTVAINDLGQIVGWGRPPGSEQYTRHGFLLNPIIPGDLNGDLVVNTSDLLMLFSNWGPCVDCNDCPADLDGDCEVGTNDLMELFSNWS